MAIRSQDTIKTEESRNSKQKDIEGWTVRSKFISKKAGTLSLNWEFRGTCSVQSSSVSDEEFSAEIREYWRCLRRLVSFVIQNVLYESELQAENAKQEPTELLEQQSFCFTVEK